MSQESTRKLRKILHAARNRVRGLAYIEKWLILGMVIGIISSCTALFFYFLLAFLAGIAAWILGVVNNPLTWRIADLSLAAITSSNRLLLIPIIGLGALISGFMVYKVEPLAEGPGVNATIRAYHSGATFSKRLPLVKAIASAVLIGFGGSGGVQGPSVQIGAGIGSIIAKILRLGFKDRRLAIIAGMAGSLSAIFRSPIGSALFAVEVLYKRDIESEALVPAVISSITSYTLSTYVIGMKGVFPQIPVNVEKLFTYQALTTYILLGFISAITALFYIKFYRIIHRLFIRIKLGEYVWIKPVIGGLVLGLLGVMAPAVVGTGSFFIAKFIEGSVKGELELSVPGLSLEATLLLLILLKILGTSFSIGSGGSGGLFAPSIFIGSLLGYLVGLTIASHISGLPPHVYAYIGMASLFGAATKTPLATSIMVTEMSGSYILAIPALISSIIASELSGNESLYEAQLIRRIQPRLTSLRTLVEAISTHKDVALIKAENIINTSYETVKVDEPCSKVLKIFVKGKQRIVPVVDKENHVIGVIDQDNLKILLEQEDLSIPVSMMKLGKAPIVRLGDDLHKILDEMVKLGIDYSIVIDEEDKYAGVVLAEDIVTAISYYIIGLPGLEEK